MATDLVLAILHHLLAFGLVGTLMAEAVLLRSEPAGPAEIDRIARLDGAYGATAGALVVVGVLRVIFGAKGTLYYVENPWFWAKMASFAAIGLLSLRPTLRFFAWRRASRADPTFHPAPGELLALRNIVRLEALLVFPVLVFAAVMARFA